MSKELKSLISSEGQQEAISSKKQLRQGHYSNKGGHVRRGRFWKNQAGTPDGLFMRYVPTNLIYEN